MLSEEKIEKLRTLHYRSYDVVSETDVEYLSHLAYNVHPTVRKAVAENLYAPEELLWEAFQNETDPNVFWGLSKNQNMPPRLAKRVFEKSEHMEILLSLAENFNTPVDILETLEEKNNYNLNLRLLININIPFEIFTRITANADVKILETIALSSAWLSKTRKYVTYSFGVLPDHIADSIMALNRNSAFQKEEFARQGSFWSEEALLRHLKNWDAYSVDLKVAFIRNEKVPKEFLSQILHNNPHREVLNTLAKNPNLALADQIHIINSHKTPSLRVSIARHTKFAEVLEVIYYNTKSEQIREAVEGNPLFAEIKR